MELNHYDMIIQELGPMGFYQKLVFILVSLFEMPAGWAMMLPLFTDMTPDWYCAPDTDDPAFNSTFYNNLNSTSAILHKACTVGDYKCTKFTYTGDKITVISDFDMLCERQTLKKWTTFLQMIGHACGAAITGQAGDMFGRKKLLYLWLLVLSAAGIISGFSVSWPMYACTRFIVGMGIGGTLVVNFILPIEFVGQSWRTFCGCIGFWGMGIMILPGIAYFVDNWKHLCIITSCAGLPLFITCVWVPESARWLVTRGRYKEAEAILTRIANSNGVPTPDFQRLRLFAKSEAEMREQSKRFCYWHLFTNCTSAKFTLILMFGWFTASFGYYGLSFGIGGLTGDLYLNVFFIGLLELPAILYVLITAYCCKMGRRWTVFSLFITAAVALMAMLFVQLYAPVLNEDMKIHKQRSMLSLALLGKAGVTGGWVALQLLTAEKFPTLVRNIGVATCTIAARAGGIIAPLMENLFNFQYTPFVASGILSICFAILVLFMSETKAIPLPDFMPHDGEATDSIDCQEMTDDPEPTKERLINSDEHHIENEKTV